MTKIAAQPTYNQATTGALGKKTYSHEGQRGWNRQADQNHLGYHSYHIGVVCTAQQHLRSDTGH